jgi:arabinan endo-1,5-alpha-L-arabinosidase
MNKKSLPWLFCTLLALTFALAKTPAPQANSRTPYAFRLEGEVKYTHDPAIIKQGDTWFLFSTGNGPNRKGELPIRCSKDLHNWKLCGHVFGRIPDWIAKESPETKELWAPDISYFNGEFTSTMPSPYLVRILRVPLLTNRMFDPNSPDFHWVESRWVVLPVCVLRSLLPGNQKQL